MSIIPVFRANIGSDITNSVDARVIHDFLGVKTHLSTWINRAIEKYGFEEGADFSILKSVGHHKTGATTKIDYIVTLDMAKELAMLENNPKGREVRKYFIACEKQMTVAVDQIDTLVSKLVKRAMMGISFTPHKRRVGMPLTSEEKNIIDELYAEYWSLAAIARELGCDIKTVSRYINSKIQAQPVNLLAYADDE